MTKEEITDVIEKQLLMLSKASKTCDGWELAELTYAMMETANVLLQICKKKSYDFSPSEK